MLKKYYKVITFAIITVIMMIIFSFSDHLYTQTIVKVCNVENTYIKDKKGFGGIKESCYEQRLTGVIRNGSHKGETVEFVNDYSYSESSSDKYSKGDKIFVNLKDSDDGTLGVTVLYAKRDSYIFLVTLFFAMLLIFLFGKRGLMTLLSVVINTGFFFFCLQFSGDRAYVDWLWILETIFFTVITLICISGIHRKTLGAILSTMLTAGIVILLYFCTVFEDKNIYYDMLPYITPKLPLRRLFLISTVTGMLGAVMDVAITINTSVSELVVTNKELTLHKLIGSVREIGNDTMGTMVNVLFFSYLSGSFPVIILKCSNDYSINSIVQNDCIYEIIRFLIGSIGIVVAIPVSGLIAILLFRKGLARRQ